MQPTSVNQETPFQAQQQRQMEETGAALRAVLVDFPVNPLGSTVTLQNIKSGNEQAFASAAALLLSLSEPSPGVQAIARLLAQDANVIEFLLQENQLPLTSARVAVRHLTDADPLFSIQMIRKVLQGFGEVQSIPPPTALRMLQVLDQASDCSRLTPYLIQLLRHPSQHVRSKCVLLLGQGNLNMSRTREFLTSPEARVRSNAVESLWGREDASTVKLLQECSSDPHHRVAVNALVGLGRLGDKKASARLINLASSKDGVLRAAAAWGMGQVKRPEMAAEFTAVLKTLTEDPEPKVQKMARTSLESLASEAG